MELVQLARHR